MNEVEVKNELPSESDSELVRQAKSGDQEAFSVLVERYQSLVCSVAYSRCGDLASSEDMAQEAFVRAWQKLSTLRETTKFKSWLCTIVRNLTVRKLEGKNRSVTNSAATLESVGDIAGCGNSPIEAIVRDEEETLVWAALSEIPENLREPMILFYREHQSVAGVASALDLSKDAVKQRLARGRKLLRHQLETTIATTLTRSKPAKAFASAVMVAIASLKSKSAAAAGLGTGVAVAGKAVAKVGILGSLGSFIAFLPVIGSFWLAGAAMYQSAMGQYESEEEKRLVRKYGFRAMAALAGSVVLWFALNRLLVGSPWSPLSIAPILVVQIVGALRWKRYQRQIDAIQKKNASRV